MTKEEIEALQEENCRLKQQAADRDARDAQVRQEQLHKDNVAFAENWSQRAVWLPAPPPWWLPCWMPSPVATSRWSLLRGKPHTAGHRLSFIALRRGAGDEFRRTGHKERVGDTVKVDVAEFAEADPERLALHQKAVALSKKEGISYEAAVARCL